MKRLLHPRQVRAARALLELSQDDLAISAQVGLATLKRFESGQAVRVETERALRSALEHEGVMILDEGSSIEGHRIAAGVALRASAPSARSAVEPRTPASETRKRVRSV